MCSFGNSQRDEALTSERQRRERQENGVRIVTRGPGPSGDEVRWPARPGSVTAERVWAITLLGRGDDQALDSYLPRLEMGKRGIGERSFISLLLVAAEFCTSKKKKMFSLFLEL